MHNLPPCLCRRTRSHTRLHPPRCRQRNRRCTFAQHTQCALSPRPHAPHPRSHHCRPIPCLFAQLLFDSVCSRQDQIPHMGRGRFERCKCRFTTRLKRHKSRNQKINFVKRQVVQIHTAPLVTEFQQKALVLSFPSCLFCGPLIQLTTHTPS